MPLSTNIPSQADMLKYVPTPADVYSRVMIQMLYAGSRQVTTTDEALTLSASNEGIIMADASGGAFDITLTAAADVSGCHWLIKNAGASNAATLHTADASNETLDGVNIDGDETGLVLDPYDIVHVYCDGTSFFKLEYHDNSV